jgi:hypothetical protein
MPRTGWTPSIVPKGDDQNVYIVVDDLGRNGRVYRKPTLRPPIWKPLSSTFFRASTKTRLALSPSTPSKAGRRMSQRTLPKSCASDATCKCVTCHPTFTSSLSNTTASTGN